MRLRVLSDDGGETSSIPYAGVRDVRKFKSMVMADVLAYGIYGRVSRDAFSRDMDPAKRSRMHEAVQGMARSLALDYYGGNSGTPADQISKRISNMIDLLDGTEQGHRSPAVTVTGEQLMAYRSAFGGAPGHRGPRGVSVTIDQSLTACGGSLSQTLEENGTGRRMSLGAVCDWITDSVLVAARDEPAMQAVMKRQCDLARTLLGEYKVSEETKLDSVRLYLSMRCALAADMRSMGDEFELMLDARALSELLIPLPTRPGLSSPVVLAISDGDIAVPSGMHAARCGSDRTEIGIRLYEARLEAGYERRPIILILGDGCGRDAVDNVLEETEAMDWQPLSLIVASDRPMEGCSSPLVRRIGVHDMRRDLERLSKYGFVPNDPGALAIIRGEYLRILELGYPLMESNGDCIALLERMRRKASSRPAAGCRQPEMVECVRTIVKGLGRDRSKDGIQTSPALRAMFVIPSSLLSD